MATKAAKKARPKKPKAAVAEVKNEQKTLSFKGLNLDLPSDLPPTMMFDFIDLEEAEEKNDPRPVFRILKSIVGDEQFVKVRNALGTTQIVPADISALIQQILGEYGLTLGES